MTGQQSSIPCSEAVRQLWDYLDHAVSAEDQERVEKHLSFCRTCCGELEFAKELNVAFASSRPHTVAMNEFEEERTRGEALFAPLRLLGGFVAGGVLGILGFGLAWSPFWPSSFEGAIQALVVLGTTALITGAIGAFMFAVRPLRHWWQLVACVALGSLGGLFAGGAMRSAILADCLHGTGPQERWCSIGYSFLPLFLGSMFAGGIAAGVLSAVGVRPSSPPTGSESGV
jgi:hypothetical protein